MSYEKRTTDLSGIDDALDMLFPDDITRASAVQRAGSSLTLDDGSTAWVSSTIDAEPATPFVELRVVALGGDANGNVLKRANAMPVSVHFVHPVDPVLIAKYGIDQVRRALSMVALGEPQPQVPIEPPAEGGPAERDLIQLDASVAATYNIRTALTVAAQVRAPVTDVL